MAKTNIGRVSVVPKSEYSSTENYKRLDVVSSDGSMYVSKKDNNIGNPLTDENWWFKAVEKGDTGPANQLSIGSVISGNIANATITGDAPNQVLNLVLPKGDTSNFYTKNEIDEIVGNIESLLSKI